MLAESYIGMISTEYEGGDGKPHDMALAPGVERLVIHTDDKQK